MEWLFLIIYHDFDQLVLYLNLLVRHIVRQKFSAQISDDVESSSSSLTVSLNFLELFVLQFP